jgi:ArsR family transcriptional regulator
MSGILNLPQPKISKHITRMRHLGLINDRKQDKFVFYSLNKGKSEFNQILKTALQVSLKDETLINDKLALKDKERYIEELCKL